MKILLTFSFLFVNVAMFGQSDKEVFHIRYNASPVSMNGDHDVLQTFDMNVKLPVVVKGKTLLAGGLGYETLWTNSYPLFGGRNVHGLSTQWLLNRSLGEHKALLLVASAGIYSDFKDISGEDVRYAFGVRYKTTLHGKFSMSYGLGIGGQFFGVMIAPFIDFDWKMTERLRLSGPLPLNTRLRYTLTPRSELIFFLKPENATFRLSKVEYESRYFQKKQWNAGFGFDYMLTKHWLLALKGGYSLRRKFEIYDASQTGVLSIFTFDLRGGKRTPHYHFEERAFFAEVTMAWVIAKD